MTQPEWELIEDEIRPHHVGDRTSSAALLAWFLSTVWRLDLPDVEDAICDGPGDRSIDALVVDDDLQEITIFQAKHYERADREEGNTGLERLVGTAANFEAPEAVDALLDAGPNLELRRLLERSNVRTKVANGSHVARAVFLTNATFDANAERYAEGLGGRSVRLDLWDSPRLAAVAATSRRPDLRPERVTLTSLHDPTSVDLSDDVRISLAMVPASELVDLPGIADRTLFARNVRLGVPGTRVNRELADTVRDADEHALFPAYHNGLTLLTRDLRTVGQALELDGISVVNGCQSLLALDANRGQITDALRLLVKIVQVDPQSDLADKITYRTNNQNSVDLRDQRSTDATQRQLQREVAAAYAGVFGYAIRAGERPTSPEILDNAFAAQMLMAVYVGEPWSAVRKVRLFDEDYHKIFNRQVTAHRLLFVHELAKLLDEARDDLIPALQASFASVRFTLAYLVMKVLRNIGAADLVDSPERWFPERLPDVRTEIDAVVADVVDAVNFYVEERLAPPGDEVQPDGDATLFDPKVAFKSRGGVNTLEAEVLRSIRADARRAARRDDRREGRLAFAVDPVR